MANPKDINVLFELQGKSLKAAKALTIAVDAAAQKEKPRQLGNLLDIRNDWMRLYATLHETLRAEQPDVLKSTGLLSPATVVYKERNILPRAYTEYPHIFSSPEKNPRFFMYCPIDYQGHHFSPPGGRLIEGNEIAHTGNLLFAGGWLGNAPIFNIDKSGIPTPADYKPPRLGRAQDEFEQVRRQNTSVCFVAAGRSLQIIKDIAGFDKNFSEHCNKLLELIKVSVSKQFPELLKGLPKGETLYINTSIGSGGHHGRGAQFNISVRQSGKVNLMAAGQTVRLQESPYFHATPERGGYVITARTDTPEGAEIAAAFASIPQKTFIQDYLELQANFVPVSDQISKMLGSDQPFPRSHNLSGLPFLVYGAKVKDKINFCPPDAIRASTTLYEWLKSDEGDINMGISLPPRPQQITDELAHIESLISARACKNKKTGPAPQDP